ncbi:molybdopterin-guanine dinucleotide biosynthesis protein A [Flavobacterium sp. 7E]|uniref:molybdenum cofactor guanylyltransferase n=1 Tax=Flavobacterium sp. 7E TaxID=2735898 RepID=UPI001570A844|nr:molybdenum cofactor guanylyltransferase [Flavobacterium sp. 7E]NRS88809.1 molybdopterin-guanine dinucleotide biosynthesis protein A [Flavobacterium sp. 7E]
MRNTITAFILAGGKSQRMGTDKGLLPLNGKPFVSHICEAVSPIVGENIVIVSSNTDYDFLGYTRIEDIIKDKGPVGGIYTALQQSKTKLNFVLSVDAPLVTSELLLWILENHSESFLMTQVQANEKSYPLIAIYDQSVVTVFEENLRNDQLRLRSVRDEVAHQTIVVPEKWNDQVQNINTQEEYQKIKS